MTKDKGTRPIRFGVTATPEASGVEWTEKACRLEGLGFDVMLVNDHLTGNRLAPMIALAAAAQVTQDLRLGVLVLANDYRHPVVLAKEAATLDRLSGGRLELGIGAGWMRADYEQAGLEFSSPGVRIARLHEAITVLNGAWADEPFTFVGEHYAVTSLDLTPKPLQRPRPPLLLGGGGPTMLRLAAHEGDIVNITNRTARDGRGVAPDDVGLQPLLRKIEIVREAAGPRWPDVELSLTIRAVSIDRSAEDVYPALRGQIDQLRGTPAILEGSESGIAEEILRWHEELGVSYFILGEDTNASAMGRVIARVRELIR